ncbi:MAG: hypothetical protein IH936_15355 [Acidobacteria bacterium]|nr:hypothetical protein [Acidobacteriota bacterium]
MAALLDLLTPSLLLDLDRLEANLDRMAARCKRLGVALRPHIKTHKSPYIGRLQAERGAGPRNCVFRSIVNTDSAGT